MKIFFVSQDQNERYDTFDSFVVVAESAEDAVKYAPCFGGNTARASSHYETYGGGKAMWGDGWCESPDHAHAIEVGIYTGNKPAGHIICASFNAG